jgi:hypothetical protein
MSLQPPTEPGPERDAGPASADQLEHLGAPGYGRLNAAAVVLWRAAGTVQLELGTNRVVVDNVQPEQLATLLSRPGSRPPTAGEQAVPLARALAAAGFLTEHPALAGREPGTGVAAQFDPELRALAGRYGDRAPAMLAGRKGSAVAVHGTSRIAVLVASTLACAGVGWVQLVHGGEVAAGDSCPGGLSPSDESSRFGVAAAQVLRRSAPAVRTDPIPRSRPPELVILTDPLPIEPTVRLSLHLDGLAHLSAAVDGSQAVIGPLVEPGRTSCLRCADLHRCERDPCWPALAVQLSSRPLRRIGSDVALCVATAGITAGQALAFLDRQPTETANATLEWQLPDWQLRRRRWPPHHDCDCGAATATAKHGRMGW